LITVKREEGVGPKMGFIPLSVPCLEGNEWAYVKECLDTNWLSTAGPAVERFEAMVARYVGTEHAISTVNGTAALHVALQVAGVEPGDEVIVSDLTFIAPANAIRYLGAFPVFVDAEPGYWQMDPDKLASFLRKDCAARGGALFNRNTGRRVRALLPVHILGGLCDMDAILSLAQEFGLPVVEDATECLGAGWGERSGGTLGILGCFSFNGNKIITTGGGGMVVTADGALAGRLRYLTTQAKDDPLEFVHGAVGYNFRLPNILAALGCAQMETLDEFVRRKRAIAARYATDFAGVEALTLPSERPGTFSTFWLYTILVDAQKSRVDSRGLLKTLESHGIQSRPLWQPMHLSPAHRGSFATDCSVSERLNREALSLPCSSGLGEEDRARVVSAVRRAVRGEAP
jgi:perosamine synthetase